MSTAPTIVELDQALARLKPYIVATPLVPWPGPELPGLLAKGTDVRIKLELFQVTGSFKARGALNVTMSLDDQTRARGLTAISAGNHAIAVAHAARTFGTTAKVVMPKTANAFRVGQCKRYGAEVVLAENVAEAFRLVEEIAAKEGRTFVHPFEGPRTSEATATIGLEMLRAAPDADAIIVPVGGGGLISGIAAAAKQLKPSIRVYGVEPEGARGMSDSLAAGAPVKGVKVQTVADSLGAPLHLPHSFGLVQRFVDEIVTVSDDAMIDCVGLIFRDLKLAVEPAPAAGVAALIGPLRDQLKGARVLLIGCGANIDAVSFAGLLGRARAPVAADQ